MQSKKGSFIEAVINTFIGYLVTLAFSPLIYRLAGVKMTAGKLNLVVFLFTILSVIRSYAIRRFFNKIIVRTIHNLTHDKSKINKDGSVTVSLDKNSYHSASQFKEKTVQGNFYWQEGGAIKFQEDKNGPWHILLHPEVIGKDGDVRS